MKLSELQTGETGVIVKVKGHGGFRKRIVEMGFISGKRVEVLLNAPLNDPVKYKIMGYEVSLRHSEADMIEVVSLEEARQMREANQKVKSVLSTEEIEDHIPETDQLLETVAKEKRHTINVALVGNPNCGKTSLFNFASGAHERVGNYAGVTVDAKEGHATFEVMILFWSTCQALIRSLLIRPKSCMLGNNWLTLHLTSFSMSLIHPT